MTRMKFNKKEDINDVNDVNDDERLCTRHSRRVH